MAVNTTFDILLHLLEELKRAEVYTSSSHVCFCLFFCLYVSRDWGGGGWAQTDASMPKEEVIRLCRNNCFIVMSTLFTHPLNHNLAAPFSTRLGG
jgi:hypothetical protein